MAEWVSFGEPLTIWIVLIRIAAATVIGAVIGMDREHKNRAAGLRTHVLVCLGATLVGLVEQATIAHVVSLGSPQINVSVGRLTSTVISGVGFLGAGTIMMTGRKITGLTTAASLWCTACLGLAVGAGYTTIAVLVVVVVLITLKALQRILHVRIYKNLVIKFTHREQTLADIRAIFQQGDVQVLDEDFHSEQLDDTTLYTNVYSLIAANQETYQKLIEDLAAHPDITAVHTQNTQ